MEITRSFWMYCHEDLRKLKRVNVLWEFIRKSLRNAGLLAGTQNALRYLPRRQAPGPQEAAGCWRLHRSRRISRKNVSSATRP